MNLRDIATAATPGPWMVGERRPPLEWERDLRATAADGTSYLHGAMAEDADAAFVATFDPQLVGRLLDVVDAAREVCGSPYVRDAEARTVMALERALDALGATEVTA